MTFVHRVSLSCLCCFRLRWRRTFHEYSILTKVELHPSIRLLSREVISSQMTFFILLGCFSFFSLSPDSTQPLDVHIDYLRGGLHSLSSDFQVLFEAGCFYFISLTTGFSFLIYSSSFRVSLLFLMSSHVLVSHGREIPTRVSS